MATPSEIRACIHERIDAGPFLPVVTVNLTMLHAHPPLLRNWLIAHSLMTPDGISMAIMSGLRYRSWIRRYPGIDMVRDVLNSATREYRVALVGAKLSVLTKTVDWVVDQGHTVVFAKDGYSPFLDTDYHQLQATNPDLILVALGCPVQEAWIHQASAYLSRGVAIGVGGAFDVWSGAITRAPKWVRVVGCEWLYRLIRQPRRVGRLLRAIGHMVIYRDRSTGS